MLRHDGIAGHLADQRPVHGSMDPG
jgi:hypothetical protein